MIGFGYDSHRFKDTGTLIIGGVEITSDFGVSSYSDGDVLLHALIDALLGAAGLDDIGTHFPDDDEKYADANSMDLLKNTLEMLNGYKIINIDATIILEKPKLAPFKQEIKKKIAAVCNLTNQQVNIKAKSNEQMGFVGRKEGIACYCVCQIEKK